MSDTYKHGAYADLKDSTAGSAVQSGSVAVYTGIAPINLVRNYKEKNLVNYPIKLTNFSSSKQKIGYSDNWEQFTLCEPVAAHFDNRLGNIGPIYVINVLDPAIPKKS